MAHDHDSQNDADGKPPRELLKSMAAHARGESIAKAEAKAEREERLSRELQGDAAVTLDPSKRSVQVQRFEGMLRERVVGQAPAIVDADRCTIFLVDEKSNSIWSTFRF